MEKLNNNIEITKGVNVEIEENNFFIPGTRHILADEEEIIRNGTNGKIKYDGNIILLPQPSDSKNDPLNWNFYKKCWHGIFLCGITALTAATSNSAGATQDSLNAIYGISYDSMNTGAGVLFLGIGLCSLFISPFSFLYGRKISYLLCITLGMIGLIWFGYAKNTNDTIWSQLFIGFSESCAEAQVQLSLTDLFFNHQLGGILTAYILSTSIGTYMGPMISGFIADNLNFRWVGWIGAIISGVCIILLLFTLDESYFDRTPYTVTQVDDSTAVNKKEDDDQLQLHDEHEQEHDNIDIDIETLNGIQRGSSELLNNPIIPKSINEQFGGSKIDAFNEPSKGYFKRMAILTPASNLKGYGFKQYLKRLWTTLRIFKYPAVLYSGLQWGAQDAWLSFYMTTQETVWYEEPWNYGNKGVSIMNVPTLIGATIGCIYGGVLLDKFVIWVAKRNNGIMEAESRLWFMFSASIISPLGMFLFGIGSGKGWKWPVPYIGLGFIGFGWGCAGDISMAYLMDAYPEMVLEGMVGVSVINNFLGCIFTFVCSYWIDALGTTKTYIVIGVLDFLFFMTTIPMIYYGKRCRSWTQDSYRRFLEIRDGI